MSATTKAAIATFAGVGLIFGGALFTAGSAMAAAGQLAPEGLTGANPCARGHLRLGRREPARRRRQRL